MHGPQETDAQFARERLVNACDTMKLLLLRLLDSQQSVAGQVHAIRKLSKCLRGGFSLLQLEKSSARKIQAISRLLSGPRDAVSRLNTWNILAWNSDPQVAAVIAGLLDQQTHSAAHRPPPKTISWCIDHVAAARIALLDVPTQNLTGKIAHGLAKLERKAFQRCRKLDHRAEADFHEARKALKAWLGAIGYLPDGIIPKDPKLDKTAELLGDENDLATLAVWLKSHGFTAKLVPDLWQTLKASRRELQRQAIKEAACLTPSSPD
jgi:hypothetical protein